MFLLNEKSCCRAFKKSKFQNSRVYDYDEMTRSSYPDEDFDKMTTSTATARGGTRAAPHPLDLLYLLIKSEAIIWVPLFPRAPSPGLSCPSMSPSGPYWGHGARNLSYPGPLQLQPFPPGYYLTRVVSPLGHTRENINVCPYFKDSLQIIFADKTSCNLNFLTA